MLYSGTEKALKRVWLVPLTSPMSSAGNVTAVIGVSMSKCGFHISKQLMVSLAASRIPSLTELKGRQRAVGERLTLPTPRLILRP